MAVEAKHPLLVKAIRIVLVFSLVFWSSLGVEWAIAFGAEGDANDTPAETQQPAEGGAGDTGESGGGGDSGGNGGGGDSGGTGGSENPGDSGGSGGTGTTDPPSGGGGGGETPSGPTDEEIQYQADVAAAQAVVDAIIGLRGATADDRARVDAVLAQLASLTDSQRALVPDDAVRELQEISDTVDALIVERDGIPDDEFDEDERFVASKHKDGTLVDIEAWTLSTDDPNAEYADKFVRSVRQTAEEHGYQTPKMSTIDGSLQIIAVPMWQGDSDLDANWKPKALKADFLKWTVVDNNGYADVSTDGGVLSIRSKGEGSFLVTCTVDNGKNDRGEQVGTDYTSLTSAGFAKDYPGKSFTVMFSVEVLGPYIDIELLQADGTTCAGFESLMLSNDQLKSYKFQANVRVYDQVHEGAIDEFRCTSEQGLKDLSAAKYGNMFDELTWQVLDANREQVDKGLAEISDRGVLDFKGDIDKDGPIIVRVSSPNGFNQNLASAEVVIGKWEEDPQGESHPQDTLRIVSNARVSDDQGASGASGGAQPPDNDENTPSRDNPGENNETQPDNTEPREGPIANDNQDENGGSASEYAIDKIYTVAQVEALGMRTETFTMQGPSGLMTVKGEGVDLKKLLADAGITDLTQVNSIDFIDYQGASTSVTWADISSGTQDPMLAVRSRVLAGDEQQPAGEQEGAELLDNTRFRLMFYGSASINADDLRWIKQIRVNVGSGEGGSEDSELEVRVDYVPVPRYKQAVLSAIPNQAVGSARFGFTWETSTDGETWTSVPDGAVQTLRLMTDDEHIGRWYRVVLETDMVNPETGEARMVTSKPVQIKEGNGFMAILAYDPPVAGQTAIFQSSIEAFVDGQQISIDPAQLKYEWQKSEDGGASWQRIDGATGPSFAVPTEPIVEQEPAPAEGAEGGEGDASEPAPEPEPTTLVYVRVVVTTTDSRIPEANRIAESNAQPLTVRVGGGDDPEADNTGTNDEENQQGAAEHLPIDDQTPGETTPSPVPTPGAPSNSYNNSNMTEITNIRVDNTPRPTPEPVVQQEEPIQPAATAPANAQEVRPDELLINPEITALVQEQQAAVDKAVTNSRPGARWTQLSTVDPTDEDVRRILADNPFAPFALPLGLGIAIAGGLEKALAFRRQKD